VVLEDDKGKYRRIPCSPGMFPFVPEYFANSTHRKNRSETEDKEIVYFLPIAPQRLELLCSHILGNKRSPKSSTNKIVYSSQAIHGIHPWDMEAWLPPHLAQALHFSSLWSVLFS